MSQPVKQGYAFRDTEIEKVSINDHWVFVLVYPIIGVAFVHIGNDNSLEELLKIPSYYTDVLVAIVVVYALGFYLSRLHQYIQSRFDWETGLKQFIRYQAIWGILIPTIFAVSVELVYLTILGIRLQSSSIFYLELPLIFTFLTLINLIYFILCYSKYASALKYAYDQKIKEHEHLGEKYFIARQGNQNIQIPGSAVAYFILIDKLTFLVTVEDRQFLFDKSMKEIMNALPQHQFYRLNRQIIAKRSSIVKYTPTDTRRLKIELRPPLVQDVFLPKAKVSQFMSWIKPG